MKKNTSKTEAVYHKLLEGIVDRGFMPGHRLVVSDLVGEFAVSRTPVREALLRLKNEGLVQGDLHRVAYVAHPTSKDAEEIYDLREVLEGLAARNAAQRVTEEGAMELKLLIKQSEEYCELEKLREFTQVDVKFHEYIAEIGGNHRLRHALTQIRHQGQFLRRTSMHLLGGKGYQALAGHKRILEAIICKDPQLAETRAREHIREFKGALVSLLKESGW
ncbi:MAG: GntR family transcriptional regulator [Desulfobacterales bacterium]|jgi:DNA-binding GntR family transcriptional regulator